MLEVKEIYKTFNPGTVNEKHALNGVNLTMEDGDFITVIGGNGAGKSTLMNALPARGPSMRALYSSMALTSRIYQSTSALHSSAVYSRIR